MRPYGDHCALGLIMKYFSVGSVNLICFDAERNTLVYHKKSGDVFSCRFSNGAKKVTRLWKLRTTVIH